VSVLEREIQSLPSDVVVERSLLGTILMNLTAYDESAALGVVAEDFFLDSHRKIYRCMEELARQGAAVDLVTLISLLSDRKQLADVGDVGYLSGLIDGLPDRPTIRSYARILKEKSAQRKVIHGCSAVVGGIADQMSSNDAMEYLRDQMLQIQTGSDEAPARRILSFSDQVFTEWEHIADGAGDLIGLSTSVDPIDVATTGIRKGELWVIGGRTGDGKTALALQIAAASCREGIPVGFVSIEMAKEDLLQRLWSHAGRIPFQRIRYPRNLDRDTRDRVRSVMFEVGKWPLFVVEDGSITLHKLLAKARLLIRQEKIQLLLVDYVQLCSAPARDEKERLTKISNGLRSLAKDTGVPIVAISQLSRPKDGNQNARPNKFSLKETGSLENDSHVIVLTYRPVDEYGNFTGEDELIIAKQRHGPVSNERVYFDSKTLTFYERDNR
jgi:replicative DNA helicase